MVSHMGVSIREAVKYAYADVPTNPSQARQGIKGKVYRIKFTENIFDNVFTTIIYDYQSRIFSFGVGVKR